MIIQNNITDEKIDELADKYGINAVQLHLDIQELIEELIQKGIILDR